MCHCIKSCGGGKFSFKLELDSLRDETPVKREEDESEMGGRNFVYLLPLVCSALFPLTFITTYIIAVYLGHVDPGFPYISDTGTNSPESCIFSQLLAIETYLLGWIIYLRYRQINTYYVEVSNRVRLANKFGAIAGALSTLGLSMVGNFQETNVYVVHMIGAFLCFGTGTIHFWIQAYITYKLMAKISNKLMVIIRTIISSLCTIFFVTTVVAAPLARSQYHGKNPRKWYPEDGGFNYHVLSTASEWVTATMFCLYLLTYVMDFRHISMNEPEITVVKKTRKYNI